MSAYSVLEHIPARLEVEQLVESRYQGGQRPLSWDARTEGADVVRTVDGKVLKLASDGGQSPPRRGWIIMVTGGNAETGYEWTLYGLPQRAQLAQ